MSADTDLLRTVLIVVALVLLIPFFMMLLAWPLFGMGGGGHMWDGTGAPWGWLVAWLGLLVILLGGGYLLYRSMGRPEGSSTDDAMEALRLAYARGELSDEEFEHRRDRLQGVETGEE